MRSLPKAVLAGLLLSATPALAGPIYGTIREGANPVRSRPIEIACPDFRPGSFRAPPAQTDNLGSYRFNIDQRGRCELRMDNGAPVAIFLSDNPIRYDFQVTRGPGGLELHRQ